MTTLPATPDPVFVLSDLERDALTELVNIGMGRAAKNLGRLVHDHVHLSTPRTEILDRSQAAELLTVRERASLVAIGQDFRGSFSGQALLIFPETNSLDLVRAVLGEGVGPEEIVDLEQEALAEIGNIILNGCLVVIANVLERGLSMSLPRVMRGDGRLILLGKDGTDPGELVLFLTIDFAVRARNIQGYLALLMDLPSLSSLRQVIREYIEGLDGGMPPA